MGEVEFIKMQLHRTFLFISLETYLMSYLFFVTKTSSRTAAKGVLGREADTHNGNKRKREAEILFKFSINTWCYIYINRISGKRKAEVSRYENTEHLRLGLFTMMKKLFSDQQYLF